jgi:hypothetical protein
LLAFGDGYSNVPGFARAVETPEQGQEQQREIKAD